MGERERREQLFHHVVRLRRAARAVPGNPDIAAVRTALERDLGETVSRRFAARMLGVSHTALDRWITSGDVPVVHSPSGRVEVPVPALLDIYESVDAARGEAPRRYTLTPTMRRQREAADRTKVSDVRDVLERGGHGPATARALAYHEAIARKLRRPMVVEAQHVLYRWRDQGRIDERYAERWAAILDQRIPAIRRQIVERSAEADDLRQNSPFAGMLSEPERRRIFDAVREADDVEAGT